MQMLTFMCRKTPHPGSSMLNPFIYDVSSLLPDQLSHPKPETATERMARLSKTVDTALAALDKKDTSKTVDGKEDDRIGLK